MARLHRRTVLRGLGGVALALPWLEAMEARAQGTPVQRYVQVFTPLGFSPGQWYSLQASDRFSLRPFASALSAHANDMIVIRGLRGWNGANGHHNGPGCVFTGRAEDEGFGISLDQEIAGLIAHDRFRSLHFGAFTTNDTSKPGERHTVFSGANRPIVPEADPRAVFKALFGGSASSGSEALEEAHRKRRSILDLVRQDFADVQVGLSATDKRRLSDHAEYLRAVEHSLTNMGPACDSSQAVGAELDPAVAAPDELSRAQVRLLAVALACDLTRVATLQWSWAVAGLRYTWLEGRMPGISSKNHHGWTHSPSTGDWSQGLKYFREIEKWYVEQVGFLLDELKRLDAFQGTLVLWGTSDARGPHGADEEGRQDRAYALFGSLNGAFDVGKVVDVQVNGYKAPADRHDYSPALLLAIAQAYGYRGATFGDPGRNAGGPMPGLRT